MPLRWSIGFLLGNCAPLRGNIGFPLGNCGSLRGRSARFQSKCILRGPAPPHPYTPALLHSTFLHSAFMHSVTPAFLHSAFCKPTHPTARNAAIILVMRAVALVLVYVMESLVIPFVCDLMRWYGIWWQKTVDTGLAVAVSGISFSLDVGLFLFVFIPWSGVFCYCIYDHMLVANLSLFSFV